ncbi:receptor-like cytosolic serine/threonine-protein kinase RBK2 [Cynara cardunculus var. scolymus]|uniref:non-specific serine/threonine protein kinase n=1 Tax=Cynara cardunculus var. scolymus TaxID=59895 RepID=A0A118JX77_CYNCS|nr:receptor-like cytosolic serine/threonine-protein kinase RBK2 [Cynara cardunculus var. scolymus]KVH95622.1 Concanavalin A-like lectin/glucanase, subgroup [Cynara cardunculus var. scolymus]
MAEEEPKKKVLFAVGNKRIIFSNPSFTISTEELGSLDKDEDEIESEPASPKASTTSGSSPASPKDDTSGSPSSTVSNLDPDPDSDPHQWHGFLRKLKKGSTSSLYGFHPSLHSIKRLTRKKSRKLTESIPALPHDLDAELHYFEASWKNFSLADLKSATNNFSHENLIGEGGYSEVYKGHLQDGQLIAVKRLIRGTPEERTSDFLSELGILVHVNHPNISHVIGYGVEGGMHLVLPLSQHGSLASLLRDQKEKLEWGVRYNIALGTASGLSYLHEGCQRRIIHRDIKAANILLSEDFKPKISDFGLAKWLPDQWMHLTVSQFEGTFGYLAPEIFMNGLIDEKTDVYAYGVLLLEIITGRPAVDESQHSVVMWAKPLIASKDFQELLDPQLSGACDLEQLHCIVSVASLCINQSPTERPKMSQVHRMLKGDEGILDCNKKFQKRTAFRKGKSMDLLEEDYDDSDLLQDDLNQQNQIALEL